MNAFVFGKFLPFHTGHESLIRFARAHCAQLTVIVCASDRELIAGEVRANWIKCAFPEQPDLRVRVFTYSEANLINSSVASESVSAAWATVFRELVPGCDLVITSEPYGEMVARHMAIAHLSYDPERTHVPVSASLIRANPLEYHRFLPKPVQQYFHRKVVILGTESTGKSTLTTLLATHFNCPFVSEAGRDLIPDSTEFTLEDIRNTAEAHARQILDHNESCAPLLFVDTDVHITQSYARFALGSDWKPTPEIRKANAAALYLYLCNDVPFIQDGTRLSEHQRNQLDISHREVLAESGIHFQEISGCYATRFRKACELVNELLLQTYSLRME